MKHGIPRLMLLLSLLLLLVSLVELVGSESVVHAASNQSGSLSTVFASAATEFGVPVSVLEGLCYMEGRLSMHNGSPSIDNGFGCMHLVHNSRVDTLDQAAHDLKVSIALLKTDLATNIRGGADILRVAALRLSPAHALPVHLADWYGALAAYSEAGTLSTALLYADAFYQVLNKGFSVHAEDGELVTLAPQRVQPNKATAANLRITATLPSGCVQDSNVDYAGAIDCILPASKYDCNLTSPCNYQDSNRPSTYPLPFVLIHDIEGTAQDALTIFQNASNQVSIHYIVDSDGTIYQVLHEKDIAYQAGNFWYNARSIGIEHAGFDATGYQWYNATEYLASAKLVAYLCQKYNIPLDHAHLVAHGTVPGPTLSTTPNHVDPGPYWLWDYYFGLINQQGVPFPGGTSNASILILHPSTDQQPDGSNGMETSANFNFFYLYTQPSTQSALIPHNTSGDITDETDNVEPDMTYYIVASQPDQAGSGDTMYEIWYGESDKLPGSQSMDGHLAWLAVPPGAAAQGTGTVVELKSKKTPSVYGEPVSSSSYIIGHSQSGSIYVSPFTVSTSGTTWYIINFNHRQAFVPSSEVTVL